MLILVTGAAGFIGSHLSHALLKSGHEVIGLDNLNDYYDVTLKYARLESLQKHTGFEFIEGDIADAKIYKQISRKDNIETIVHLAAQAGVRYSISNPIAYGHSNLDGHLQILEFARNLKQSPFLVYASSSSVYGNSTIPPFKEDANVSKPVSLYAATKLANEMMSYSYAHLYGLRQIGLRFFTVYGPWGRPDMAYWGFSEDILENRPIKVFNHGNLRRDFTYIDDIVEGIKRIVELPAKFEGEEAPHKIYNIGNNNPVELLDFIEILENALGKKAIKEFLPMQMGDVYETSADISALHKDYGFAPSTNLKDGLQNFADWFLGWKGLGG